MKRKRGVIWSLEPEAFAGIYAEIAAELDSETAMRIFEMCRGQTIVFPQKLYNRDYVRAYIHQHRDHCSVQELARMFGYSDRRIRQFLAEEKCMEATEADPAE